MTGPDGRYRLPSPRTSELPMAFTGWEFTRGALIAWLGFNLLAPLVIAGSGIVAGLLIPHNSGIGYAGATLVIAPMVLVPWSLGAVLILGAPLALVLGRALRGTTRRRTHRAAFAGLGAFVGAATTIVYTWYRSIPPAGVTITYHVSPPTPLDLILANWWMILLMAGTTATTVALGWRLTATWALRADMRGAAETATV